MTTKSNDIQGHVLKLKKIKTGLAAAEVAHKKLEAETQTELTQSLLMDTSMPMPKAAQLDASMSDLSRLKKASKTASETVLKMLLNSCENGHASELKKRQTAYEALGKVIEADRNLLAEKFLKTLMPILSRLGYSATGVERALSELTPDGFNEVGLIFDLQLARKAIDRIDTALDWAIEILSNANLGELVYVAQKVSEQSRSDETFTNFRSVK
jgi:hypothetical protein